MRWFDAVRARLRLLFAPRAAEERMDEEFRFHIEMETERLVREKRLPLEEARRRALVAFGGVEQHREELREGRGLAWLRGMSLDLKLGFRMLVKHPMLTLVAGLVTFVAIGMCVAYFEIARNIAYPSLPFEDGDRVVTIRNDDLAAASPAPRSLHDFAIWRNELESVQDLAVFTTYGLYLAAGERYAEPVEVVEISAEAFRIARIPPLLGRPLVEADQEVGARPVVVIGERLWEARFDRDPGVVGRSVELGTSMRTVVGIMPEDFALPVQHEIWVPLRLNPLNYEHRQGPVVGTIGRLAAGATLEGAEAELTAIGERLAAQYPETHAKLHPRIVPYLEPFTGGIDITERVLGLGLNAIFIALLVVMCANAGSLVFARIATRESELAVRTALGAARGRIVMQFFVEALVLASVGALLALVVMGWGLRQGMELIQAMEGGGGPLPFWWESDLSATTIVYAGVLTVLAAIVTGALPALKATGRGIQASLQHRAAGGHSKRSRGISAAVIVAQVAISGALLPLTAPLTLDAGNWFGPADRGVQTAEFLTARYGMTNPRGGSVEEAAQQSARVEAAFQRLKGRLLADPGFAGVTFANLLPGMSHPDRSIEVVDQAGVADSSRTLGARSAMVGVDFFDTFGVPILAGRSFDAGDLHSDHAVAIVNESFVRKALGGRNAIGQRVRYPSPQGAEPGETYQIVGVVPDLGMAPLEPDDGDGIYHPAAPGQMPAGLIAVRVRGDPEALAPRFRSIAAGVDPSFLIHDVRPLDDVGSAWMLWVRSIYLIALLGIYFMLFLSAVMTFSLMSFTVSRRTREIGVRKALGAREGPILTSVFSRAVTQLGIGGALGIVLGSVGLGGGIDVLFESPGTILTFFGVFLAVGLVACAAPALRALRIEATEAMRNDL